MTKSLSSDPSLEQLKNQAKDLLKAHKSGDENVCDTLRLLPKFAEEPSNVILSSKVTLQEVQHALSMDYGFENWQALRQEVLESQGESVPPDVETISFVNATLTDAVKSGASDLHFEPNQDNYRIRFRKDGITHEFTQVSREQGQEITERIKLMAEMDISERQVPQLGRIKMRISETKAIDFRVSTLPVLFGEKVAMRILDPASSQMGIAALGFEPEQEALFMEALRQPLGLVLVTGPAASGRTVTLYSGISILNIPEVEIATVEDPVEINLEGINQCPINTSVGLDYEKALQSCMTQDPDVVLIGEISEAKTANMAIKIAQSGHLVLAAMHSTGAPEALMRLSEMGITTFDLTSTVKLVTAQRLARRLCTKCKARVDIPKHALIEAGFQDADVEAGLQLFGPDGCDKCEGGYKGRIGIHEVVKMTPEISRIVMEGGDAKQIAEECQRAGFPDIKQSSLQKVKDGVVSLDQVGYISGL